jgi:hypothetical protein
MRPRKRFVLLGAMICITGAGMYLPTLAPSQHALVVEKMNALLVPDHQDPANVGELAGGPSPQFHFHIQVAGLNPRKNGKLLISDADGRVVCGRVKDNLRLMTLAQSLPNTVIMTSPHCMSVNGCQFAIAAVAEVVMDAREGARRHCGVTIRGVPTLRKDGRIYLTFGLNMTDRISDHPMNEADFDVLEIKSTIVLKDGETGFIGGVTRKCMETEQTALPGLSALPGIGSWFQFSRRVVIDQEILVLITPKIVHDHRR